MNRRVFLRNLTYSAVGLALSQLVSTKEALAATTEKGVLLSKRLWRNWSGNVRFSPHSIFAPKNSTEVRQIILQSQKVRPIGSGHSFSAIVPEISLMSATNFKKISVDKENLEVTVGSGVTLHELNQALNQQRLALTSMGEIDEQTIAGLVATSTKGTCLQYGSFSDEAFLLGLSLVDGLGRYRKIDFKNSHDQERYKALRTNMGAFGFVTDVTLKVVPQFNLLEEKKICSLEEALNEKHYRENYRYCFYYHPHSNMVRARFQNKTTAKPSLEARRTRQAKVKYMENILANMLLKAASYKPSLVPRIDKIFTSTFKNESFVDTWNEVMITKRTMRYYEMQYSLPAEYLKLAMQKITSLTEQFARKGLYYVDLPFFVRFTRGDRGTILSPFQGEGVFAHIDMNAHYAQKGYEAFFKAIEKELLLIGGKPHWSKLFYSEPGDLYEDLALFERTRQEFDPENKFQNKFIQEHISFRV